ncbi:TetR family transcriptional regulator [Rhodococcus pyridinivorans]|uniref:TetR/AcrR family transcriptional regulator n=1 Tax=Rhodococcus pyridinivorans TaxID=103816 RepID=UPI0020002CDF|nr:TetR/AcrR family transcriptional regulator [Rhodococcus pyridinivorans]UPK64989.1 TetR family transcriptional regulator [Rhodococcus pyridinivorans]
MVVTTRDDARSRIVHATLYLVGTDGVAGVTNRRIAARAEVSLGSITYHFPTQADLLRAALEFFVDEETERLRELAEQYRSRVLSLTEAAELTERVAHDLTFTAERIAPFELYVQAGRDEELRRVAERCWRAYDALTVSVLSALGVPDPEAIAPTVVATITGLQLRRLSTGTEPDLSEAVLLLLHGAAATRR